MAEGGAVVEIAPEGEFGELAQRGGFIVGKGDAERYDHEDGMFWNYAQGDASFEGAEFTVYQPVREPRLARRKRRWLVPGVRGVRPRRGHHDDRHRVQRVA